MRLLCIYYAQANLRYIFLRAICIPCFCPPLLPLSLDFFSIARPYIFIFPPTFSREFDFREPTNFHVPPDSKLTVKPNKLFPLALSLLPALYYQFSCTVFPDALIKPLLGFSILTNRRVFRYFKIRTFLIPNEQVLYI